MKFQLCSTYSKNINLENQMHNKDLSDFRNNYKLGSLAIDDCKNDPNEQFQDWLKDAIDAQLYEPNAMQIATVGKDQQPSLRTVLLKEVIDNGFVFYTNYNSKKGQQLSENNYASLLFWWREQERQVRIEGIVEKFDRKKNEKYFYSRPHESQIGALTSPQSKVIPNRAFLDNRYDELAQEFENKTVPFPDYWGGYILIPNLFEFWQGRESRLHDRIEYILKENCWTKQRLAP